MRKVLAVLGVVAVLLPCLLVGAAGPAAAHAALVSTDPADGSTLEALPQEITLTFNEPVGQPAIVVTAPDGTRVSEKASSLDATVTAPLEGEAQKGRYTLAYRVVSADGHPIAGETTFTSTTGKTVTASQTEKSDEATFVHRHRSHFVWAAIAAVVGLALILAPLVRRPKA
ncbi:hypothetical protein ASD11_06450 [Aeromicrobium sp. Root495]|uniref:copper resistance CopC family protein n=1 Tax=Aeromicrobium sp. Root495 TaxID=1736550 RepID=UPI0006F70210|nr:copper resistance CopC family protein [Aeromicrobium sp. Root495]KQY59219.1 hypothetical protein ASD11_06450 [Aeromicrobium sp. Root495]